MINTHYRRDWNGQMRVNGALGFGVITEAIQSARTPPTREITSSFSPPRSITLREWAQAYLQFSKSKFCKTTYEEKETIFKRLFECIDANTNVKEFASSHGKLTILNYITKQGVARSGNAANKERKNLVAAWNWGIKYLDMSPYNPCMVEKMPEIRQPRYIPPEEDF